MVAEMSVAWGDQEKAGLVGMDWKEEETVLARMYHRLHVGGNRELAGS